jgi:hypothetical protein
VHLLTPLKEILAQRKTKSHQLIEAYERLGSIEEALQQTYLKTSQSPWL